MQMCTQAHTYTPHKQQNSEHVKWKRFLMVLIQRVESLSELRGCNYFDLESVLKESLVVFRNKNFG